MGTKEQLLQSKHYYQGGYEYDFVEELDRRFECPICLLCQRDPHQTSCGHRFCYSCILTWLNEGMTCPKDNCSLGEGDLFPDTMAQREILNLLIKCPNQKQGCMKVMPLTEANSHFNQCQYSKSQNITPPTSQNKGKESLTCECCGELVDETTKEHKSRQQLVCPNASIACPFTSVGCMDKVMRKELQGHVQTHTHKHMQLLCEQLMKLHQIQGQQQQDQEEETKSGPGSLPDSSNGGGTLACRTEDIRLSGSAVQSTQKLLKDLFRRVVRLEQKNCQLEIANEQLRVNMQLESNLLLQQAGRYCNGNFVWKISNFSSQQEQMRRSRSFALYSPPFYTSAFGYKMCLRCNVSIAEGAEYLGLFVHLMRGDNDNCLKWPFAGEITLTASNLVRADQDFSEVLTTSDQAQNSLERPRVDRNIYGYGFREFMRLDGLYFGGFVHNDVFVIRAVVQALD